MFFFDADNTLFDFDAAERRALNQTLTHYGYPADEARRSCYLAINRALWSAFDRGELEKDFLVVERFAALQRELGGDHDPAGMNRFYLSRLAEGADLLPGAEDLCRALAPYCTLAILTNGLSIAQRGRFSRSPLKALIPHLFISGEMDCQKPQKVFFDKVLAALALPAGSRAVMVGDSLAADIQGAVNAGLDSVWYAPGGGQPDPDGPQPTYVARSFDDIRSTILDITPFAADPLDLP